MPDDTPLYNSLAPLRNVSALAALVDRLKNRAHGLPGMATFYGPSGYGKTTAGTYVTNEFDAVCVQVKSTWTQKKLCEAILSEMSVPPHRMTISDMVDRISATLAVTDAPLLIDEADFLVKRRMIEIVRDFHEGSGAPVILIGEELLPQKLKQWERVHGRMLDWVAAQPADTRDLSALMPIYAPGIDIASELQDRLMKAANGSIRRICVNLEMVREFARLEGLDAVTLEDWGKKQFWTGEAPGPRRGV
ncbi:AAA domain-containing protein [Roseivivax halotolerans]|uniref:AAA domain-containing protein n=1 Tax=Roseivivax halotolerans TaxID=93684 RepID=A0A1I5W268_9RHOB|nr:ATP-binding protein [Roseivivax halotolerans]SFQ13763.1 AAA domain-containing protein [Roseivivax halotolerans]